MSELPVLPKHLCSFIPMCSLLRLCLTLLRFVEPDPSHTLEERVVHWYFAQLDNNGSHDINKKELKAFKRYLKKKPKPKKCSRKFSDYCDLNKDKAISLQELKGCLGVSKEGKRISICTGQPVGPAKYMYTPVLVDHPNRGLQNRTETIYIMSKNCQIGSWNSSVLFLPMSKDLRLLYIFGILYIL